MFLEKLKEINPSLIKAGVYLHQNGFIPPNTYLLDADQIEKNAGYIKEEAKKWNLKIYFMFKQIRNPQIYNFVLDKNIPQTVCVDTKGAKVVWESGNLIGHVGHLVQIPDSEIMDILLMKPEVVTVFTIEKARKISYCAKKIGRVQNILLRVNGENDIQLPGMEGGISEKHIEKTVKEINKLNNVKIVGVTNFPAMYYTNNKEPKLSPNFYTSLRCAEKLSKMGIEIEQINAPGNGCTLTMETYSKGGATHVEPGHGITGTTPFALNYKLPEVPSIIYISEVLHIYDDFAYVMGGFGAIDVLGVSKDFKMQALVGDNKDNIFNNNFDFEGCAIGNKKVLMDYHGILKIKGKKVKVGDTAIFGFRPQTFATRCANTAIIKGCSTGDLKLLGVYDHCCHRLKRWP